jgi:hypothetical protein
VRASIFTDLHTGAQDADEHKKHSKKKKKKSKKRTVTAPVAIEIQNGEFQWDDKTAEPTLKDVDITIRFASPFPFPFQSFLLLAFSPRVWR